MNLKKVRNMNKRQKTTEIIVHCSATPEGKDFSIDQIRQWHKNRGFEDIGYHYVVYRDGSVHAGRPENTVGAHCVGHNSISVGVCYIGGVDVDGNTPKDTRTAAQKTALRNLLTSLSKKYHLKKGSIHGHRDFAKKACPSFDATNEYKSIGL